MEHTVGRTKTKGGIFIWRVRFVENRGQDKMRKANISSAIIISVLIGVIGLWLLFTNGYRLIAYRPYDPCDLSELSESEIKPGRYVQGDISDCFKISYTNTLGVIHYMGSDCGYFVGTSSYCGYTIPIADGRYIRVWMREWGDSQKGMQSLVDGQNNIVPFTGQIKKGADLNSQFYDHAPDFDQSRIVAEYSIWEKDTDSERNMCILGLVGLLIAWMLYRSSGGIEVREVMDADVKTGYSHNQKNELDIANKLLDKYHLEEKANQKKAFVGILFIALGVYIDFGLDIIALKIIGFLILLFGIKICFKAFMNSSNRIAVWISRKFSIRTIQTKIHEQEQKKAELTAQINDCELPE